MDRRQSSQVTMGVLLVAIGLIFLGDQLGFSLSWNFGRLWPLILIVLGTAKVARSSGGSGGYMLALIGIIFLLHTYGIMTLDSSWPLFIVAAGLSMLFGGRRGVSSAQKEPGHAD